MVTDQKNIAVLNCLDENPHKDDDCGTLCKYRHGNVSVHAHDKMRFPLVIWVVEQYADYNFYNDTMISEITNESLRENEMHKTQRELYESTDSPYSAGKCQTQ